MIYLSFPFSFKLLVNVFYLFYSSYIPSLSSFSSYACSSFIYLFVILIFIEF